MLIFVSITAYSLWGDQSTSFQMNSNCKAQEHVFTVFHRSGKKKWKFLHLGKLGMQFSFLTKPHLMFIPLLNTKWWTGLLSLFVFEYYFWLNAYQFHINMQYHSTNFMRFIVYLVIVVIACNSGKDHILPASYPIIVVD